VSTCSDFVRHAGITRGEVVQFRLFRKAIAVVLLTVPAATFAQGVASGDVIQIERQGAFAVGGEILGNPDESSLRCDHGVVEFQIPLNARAVNLLMWHSAS